MSDAGAVQAGYAVISLDQGDAIPSGTLIFQMHPNGKLMTEAGVAAIPATTKARIFVDRSGTETGIALASPGNPAATVQLKWLDRLGRQLGTTQLNLPAGGHTARFAYELNPDLPAGFTGILEIESPVPVVPITLMLTYNQRSDLILTTMPVADLTRPAGDKAIVFPQVAFGSGYETRLILISTEIEKSATVNLSFYQSNGSPLTVPLAGTTNSRFTVQLNQGSASQLRPGNVATAKEIVPDLQDPGGSEIAVNVGNSIYLNPVVLDSTGRARDDFWFVYLSTNPEIAAVDAQGKITGKQAGFSTLLISTGSVVKVLTICIVGVNSGAVGYQIPGTVGGVAQDRANRIYTASVTDQTVWLGKSVGATPERYAGVSQSAGLKNDVRLQSLFHNPSFLAVDELNKVLYVSDGGNKAIRRVFGGEPGRVDTLTTDLPWSNPQGLALDTSGYLWVCDTDSHTIRRIFLQTGKVEIVAGSAGKAGYADGQGDKARFSSPSGIALEFESLARQLQRECTGEPPPAASVIVVDSGNNQIRRVTADGVVTTIGPVAAGAAAAGTGGAEKLAAQFNGPVGVAVDAAGNIFVSEPDSNRVRVILASTGKVVQAVQPGSLVSPRSLAAGPFGYLLIGTNLGAAQEIFYGQPTITNVSPKNIPAEGGVLVTIKGSNFSPDTVVTIGRESINGLNIRDTETLTFTAPSMASGRVTLSVQNRGGLAQQPVAVQPKSLADLPAGYITTVAGGSTYSGEGSSAISASIGDPYSLALDSRGNVFFASYSNNRIFKVDRASGVLTAVAGTTGPVTLNPFGDHGDGKSATAARLDYPTGIALDRAGNLLIAEYNRIRRVEARTGIIHTVAGGGWSDGEGVPAIKVYIQPYGVWADDSGNIFFTTDHRVRKVDTAGIITTIAGTGRRGFSGDGGSAKSAALSFPTDLTGDRSGNLYFFDYGNSRLRKVDAAGNITTIAGNGECKFSGDGGPAVKASLCGPGQISFDIAGNLYIADAGDPFKPGTGSRRIRKIDPAGIITTIAGKGGESRGDGGPATEANFAKPLGLAVDSAGQIFIGDFEDFRVRLIDVDGQISTIAGNSDIKLWGDGEAAWSSTFHYPNGISADAEGNYYVTDLNAGRIRRVDGTTGVITTVAGGGEGSDENILATDASLSSPSAAVVDSAGNLLIADNDYNNAKFLIRKVDAVTKRITTIAGKGQSSSDDIQAADAKLDFIDGMATDGQDNLYITQPDLNIVRKIDYATGRITTVAGNGQWAFSGDGGPATAASLAYPSAVATDRAGNIYIADELNGRVRRVDSKGIITTIAGNGDLSSLPLVGGPATQVSLAQPGSLAVDSTGNVYIVDPEQHSVVRVDAVTGILTTVAGDWYSLRQGYEGDGGPAAAAVFEGPDGLALDPSGNLLIADSNNGRIRAVKGPFPVLPPAGQSCNLFSDNFAGGDLSGWKVSSNNASWQVTGGKLQVSGIQGDQVAVAEHSLPGSTYFRLNMNVEVETPDKAGYGFMIVPLNQALTFTETGGAEHAVAGIGIWATESNKVGLLIRDAKSSQNFIFDAAGQEAVSSLGMEWRNDRILLLVNGMERFFYAAESFGVRSLKASGGINLDLLGSGPGAKIRFSGLCQRSIAASSTTIGPP